MCRKELYTKGRLENTTLLFYNMDSGQEDIVNKTYNT